MGVLLLIHFFLYAIRKTDKYNKCYFYFYDKERNDSMAKE